MIRTHVIPSFLVTFSFIILTGIAFPLVVWGFAQVLFPYQANGSFYRHQGKIIGSEIIGQNFTLPNYFHPRPSAAGNGYDPTSSGGTNLGPTSKKLFSGQLDDPTTKDVDESFSGVEALAKSYREENGLTADALVPVDAVTRSASGLDPDITPLNASLQAKRVARERGIPIEELQTIIEKNTVQRYLGIFGEPRVNVMLLNVVLDSIGDQKRH